MEMGGGTILDWDWLEPRSEDGLGASVIMTGGRSIAWEGVNRGDGVGEEDEGAFGAGAGRFFLSW